MFQKFQEAVHHRRFDMKISLRARIINAYSYVLCGSVARFAVNDHSSKITTTADKLHLASNLLRYIQDVRLP